MTSTTDTFFLRCIWGPRRESLLHCVQRLEMFLSNLSMIDKSFTKWQDTSRNQLEWPTTRASLENLLKRGINKKDVGTDEIPELGYTASLIAGSGAEQITLRIKCGGYSSWVSNLCSIEFPSAGAARQRLLNIDVLTKIMESVVINWNPDQGVVTSHQCTALIKPVSPMSEAGWLTYLSNAIDKRYSDVDELVEKRSMPGTLIVATREVFSSGNEFHVDSVRKVHNAINQI